MKKVCVKSVSPGVKLNMEHSDIQEQTFSVVPLVYRILAQNAMPKMYCE